jgi:hypothetical protein
MPLNLPLRVEMVRNDDPYAFIKEFPAIYGADGCPADLSLQDIVQALNRQAAADKLAKAVERIAEPAKTAEELGVKPGMDYWCTVAVKRQDIAVDALTAYREVPKRRFP